jgi:hypothetical protein
MQLLRCLSVNAVKVRLPFHPFLLQTDDGEQEIFIDAVQSTGLDTAAYKAARGYSVEFGDTNGMGAVFDKYNLDAIAIPSEVATTPAAIVGWPIVSLLLFAY